LFLRDRTLRYYDPKASIVLETSGGSITKWPQTITIKFQGGKRKEKEAPHDIEDNEELSSK
jgi:hypothetical protein